MRSLPLILIYRLTKSSGWVHIRGDKTAYTNYYKKMKADEADMWPPKYWKFQLETEGTPKVEVAFTDPRRFGRVRLVDCPGEDIRKHTPLKENGPDPVNDLDVFTEAYLSSKMKARHVPIKALLLDQGHISGIGNWVADEVLYQSKAHPEQYCDDFHDDEIKRIYEAIRYVCQTAVDKLGDSDEFPADWLFNHRWGKGDSKKGGAALPNGEKLAFITVGGRTSCYAPERQKKTGRVVPSAKEEPIDVKKEKGSTPAKGKAKGRKAKDAELDEEPPAKKKRAAKDVDGPKPKAKAAPKVKKEEEAEAAEPVENGAGRRRSTRLKK